MIKISCDTSKLENQIKSLLKDIDKVAEEAVKESCTDIKEDAKRLCPVDSGRLRDSISDSYESKSNEYTGYVYTDVPYAPYVEHGTLTKAPNPFMYPAYKENEEFIRQRIIDAINKMRWWYDRYA